MSPIAALRTSRFGRFLGVGAVNTTIDLALYCLLVAVGVPTVVANLCSTSAGLAFSFIANRRFTFRVGRRAGIRDVVAFIGVTGIGLWVLQPVVIAVVGFMVAAFLAPLLTVVVSKLCAIAVGVVWNWVWYSRLLFRSAEVERRPGVDPVSAAL
jgi:putative flippase GtrA